MPSDALKNLSIANAPQQTEGEKAKASIAAARNAREAAPRTLKPANQTSNPITSAITPEDMKSTPVINVQAPAVPTAAPALQAELEAGAAAQQDAFTQAQTQAKEAAATTKNTALEDYLAAIGNTQGEIVQTATQYAQAGGVDDIQNELNTINQQILVEQTALRRSLEAVDKAGGGLKAGAQSEKANLERESLAKQADLSIIQMGVQGRFDSAKAIADRAVAAKLETQKTYNDALKFSYEENKDLFTTAEQREFETLLGNRERALTEETDRKKSIYELGIQAQQDGAPADVVQKMFAAKTKEEAANIGGSYIGALEREAQRANIAQSYASIENSRLGAAKTRLEIQDIQAKQAAIDAAVASGELMLDEKQKETAYKLGKDFEAESKDFKTRVDSLNTVIASAQDPSAAGDLALIFSYMKMLDPTSVVREQEFANAQNAAGIPERIRAQYNNALRGERLTENTRTDFVDRATDIYNSSLDQQMELESRYKDKAVNLFGLPEQAADLVVQDIRAQGAVSDVVFGVQLNNASDAQLQELVNQGLIKPQ